MAKERSDRPVAPSRWRERVTIALALAPALGLVGLLFGSSLIYGVAQSLGYLGFLDQTELSFAAYRNLLAGPDHAAEFWNALLFSLWVSFAATLLSALLALALVVLLGQRLRSRAALTVLTLNLAFPHVVWAIGLSLLLAQSGLLARLGTALGLIERPADFPVLVRDRYGFGIILDYVTKETPFLVLLLLSMLRSQTEQYVLVAATLGANAWQQVRYVTLPLLLPGLLSGSLLVFAFIFGAYEVPAILGVRFPQMIAVLALEFFRNPDLRARSEAMAISVLMTLVVVLLVLLAQRWRRVEPQ